MATKKLPDQAYLRECFDYNPETGVLTWRKRPSSHFANENIWGQWNGRQPTKRAGTIHPIGYRVILINSRRFSEHRIIFKWMTGIDPLEVDHINGKKGDNRWNNLREANRTQNVWNARRRKDARFLKGAYRNGGGWSARIQINGALRYLGYFTTPEDAHEAYCEAARKLQGKFFNQGH